MEKFLLLKVYYLIDNRDYEYLEIDSVVALDLELMIKLQSVTKKLKGDSPLGRLEHLVYRFKLLSWLEAKSLISIFDNPKDTHFGAPYSGLIPKIKQQYSLIYNTYI